MPVSLLVEYAMADIMGGGGWGSMTHPLNLAIYLRICLNVLLEDIVGLQ